MDSGVEAGRRVWSCPGGDGDIAREGTVQVAVRIDLVQDRF